MKKQISRALLGLAATLALAVAAHAQVLNAVVIRVPFDFVAGAKQMPAGRYTVRRVRVDSESALLIRGEGSGAAAVVLTNRGGENPSGALLTFRQHGERYFLAEVSMPGAASAREVPKTGGERAAQREAAARSKPGTAEPKSVTIAGSLR